MFWIHVSRVPASAVSAVALIGLVFSGVGHAAPNPTCTVAGAGRTTPFRTRSIALRPAPQSVSVRASITRTCLSPRMASHSRARDRGLTVLEPPDTPVQVCLELFFPPVDYENNGLNGICVANVDSEGNLLGVVNDVRVTGFTVHGFPGVGIVFAGTNRPRADHNVAANNNGYGITAFDSTHGVFEYNVSYGSHDAGFYVGDSPEADFTVQNNTAFADLWGILVRDSATGRVQDNLLYASCAGLVFLNTGTIEGVHNWRASHNIATGNDNYCAAKDTELPFTLTGTGILIAGGDHIVLQENRVSTNQPGGDPSIIHGVPLAGGIVVVSTADVSVFPGFYGSVAAHNIIVNNLVLDNRAFRPRLRRDGHGQPLRFQYLWHVGSAGAVPMKNLSSARKLPFMVRGTTVATPGSCRGIC